MKFFSISTFLSSIALFSLPITVLSQIALIQPTENQTLTPGQPFTVELGHDIYVQNIVYASASGILFKDETGIEALYLNSTLLDGAPSGSGVTLGSGDDHYSTTYKFQVLLPEQTFANASTAVFTVNVISFVGISWELWNQVVNTTIKLGQPNNSSTSTSSSVSSSQSSSSNSARGNFGKTDFLYLLGLSLLIGMIGGLSFV